MCARALCRSRPYTGAVRILFAGTPAIAADVLRRLIDSPHEVVCVLTRPDAPVGRRRRLTPSPVAEVAEQAGIPVVRAARVTDEALAAIADTVARVDLGVVVAYGAILPDDLLEMPDHGWVNLHVSLLPRWRGAAPVQRAIAAGDEALGYSIIRVTSELDAGEILQQRVLPGLADATAGEVLDRMGHVGADGLVAVIDAITTGTANPRPQHGEVTVARKLDRDFGRLDWARPAREVFDRWRAATPEPGAWTTLDAETVKVAQLARLTDPADAALAVDAPVTPGRVVVVRRRVLVGTGDGLLELRQLQPAGRKAMAAHDWANGLHAEAVFA